MKKYKSVAQKRLEYAKAYFDRSVDARPRTLHTADDSPFKMPKSVQNNLRKYGDKALDVALQKWNNRRYNEIVSQLSKSLIAHFGATQKGRIKATKRDIKRRVGFIDMKPKKRNREQQAADIFYSLTKASEVERSFSTFAVWLKTANEIFGSIKTGKQTLETIERKFLSLNNNQRIKLTKQLFNGKGQLSMEALYRLNNGNDYDYELSQDITSRTQKSKAVKRDFNKLLETL